MNYMPAFSFLAVFAAAFWFSFELLRVTVATRRARANRIIRRIRGEW